MNGAQTENIARLPLIVIGGPTASGKSDLAVELSLRLHGSVISADSMQVYRGMDIGSAKVTEEEMRGVPHALIDIADPEDEWNVYLFQKKASAAIEAAHREGLLPFVTGGTGFYIRALLYGTQFTETETDTTYREACYEQAKTPEGLAQLYEQLKACDPASAEAIHPNNVKRLVRALEYFHQTGQRISEHNGQERARPPVYDHLYFALTMDREELYRRIDLRVDRMVENGLVEEVERLLEAGVPRTAVSMQGLGYKETAAYLQGECTLPEAVEKIKTGTRHFAKRQLTWLKQEKDVIWIDRGLYADTDEIADDLCERIRTHYK